MKLQIKRVITKKNECEPDALIEYFLKERGIQDKTLFLTPPHPITISPLTLFDKKSFDKVYKLLGAIRKNSGMIIVYTDYDADGITGGAIVWETLHLLGFRAMPYVPSRFHEGYGFSKKGIDSVKKLHDPSLIISVDHGISAKEHVSYAKDQGIPIIVTDHHMASPERFPKDAEVVFHHTSLSGSGVGYFFAKALYEEFKKDLAQESRDKLKDYFTHEYVSLASIGTIADLVPLLGASRAVVSHGLSLFHVVKRIGILTLLEEAGIRDKKITPYEIGFMVAPRINAIGRLEHALDALRLLCTKDRKKAVKLAHKLGQANKNRQDLLETALSEAEKLADSTHIPKIITLISPSWSEGIIGLIAAKIADRFYRPTIAMTLSNGFAKGSARSIPGFDITSFLRSLKSHLIDVGGHAQAAGFTIEKTKIDQFKTAILRGAEKSLSDEDLKKTINVDVSIPCQFVDLELVKSIQVLYPFGMGNPTPVFYSDITVYDAYVFGKDRRHLKIIPQENPFELLFFGEGDKISHISRTQKIGVVYTLDIDTWNGREKIKGKGKYFITSLK